MGKLLLSFIKVWHLINFDIYHRVNYFEILSSWQGSHFFPVGYSTLSVQYNCISNTVKCDGTCSEKVQCGILCTEFKPIQHNFWWHQKRIANFQTDISVFQFKCFEARVTKQTTDFKGLWMHKDMMCNGMKPTADCSLNICIPRNKM
jgi:hypothetical protein